MRVAAVHLSKVVLIVATLLCGRGCVVDELLDHPETVAPGGTVIAALTPGVMHKTAAVASGKSEPLLVEGASAELTFSLTAGDDLGGGTARADLAKPSSAVVLTLTPTSRTRLEVHAEGSGCVGQTGIIHLSTDVNGTLGGDFSAFGVRSGVTPSPSPGDVCRIDGTLSGVPVDR